MRIYSSLWNADDWATRGGLVKTDWSQAPFTPTETSKLMLAFGLLEHLLALHLLLPLVIPGFHNSWTLQIKTG